jgi:hypothetical protein
MVRLCLLSTWILLSNSNNIKSARPLHDFAVAVNKGKKIRMSLSLFDRLPVELIHIVLDYFLDDLFQNRVVRLKNLQYLHYAYLRPANSRQN